MKNNFKEEYNNKFQKALNFLNKEQREAVEQTEGPVVVIAGPGTGKTQILTLRIANIIDKMGAEFAPNILALTFTNAGVFTMRKRLAEFIGTELAYQVGIYTFHSFAEEQIKSNPEVFKRFAFSRAISDIEKIEIIEEILNKGKWKKMQTFASEYHYTQKIISAIDDLKSDAISPEKFEESFAFIEKRILAKEGEGAFYKTNRGENKKGDIKKDVLKKITEQKEKQKELLKIYIEYQNQLKERRLYDFSDMILSVVQEAEINKDFRTSLQEKYLYLLVDEHQDTNEAQNRIIELIADADINEANPNVFTVGDEKQAIYRFQGASLEAFNNFKKKYNEVKIINLKNNYRSSQNILDISALILKAENNLEAKNKEFLNIKEKVKVGESQDRKSEIIFLAEDIKKKIDNGVDPNEIAIFYKQNKEVSDIKDILEKYKIPYKINSKENILDNKEIKKIIILLRAIDDPYNNEKLSKSLFINFLNFDTYDILKIFEKMNNRRGEQIKNKSILKIISSKEILDRIEVNEVEKFLNFVKFIREINKNEKELDFGEFFEKFINDSSFLKYILKLKDNILPIKRLEKIFNEVKNQIEIKKNYSLKDFLNYIDILEKYDLKVEVGKNELLDGVNLMTAHGSKGLEFEYVYITNFINSLWGKSRKMTNNFILPTTKTQGGEDDERRLFYVALTRGKKEVKILYSKIKEDGKENAASLFLDEIKDEVEFLDIQEKDFSEKIKILFSEKEEKILSIFDKEYIKKLFLENTLSISALNNYYRSPIKYFFRNLIRLPSSQTKPLIFGNIIHNSLDIYFKKGKEEKRTPSKKELLEIFQSSLKKFTIPEKHFDEIESHGREILEKYYDRYSNEFNFKVETEKKIYSEIKLNGGEKLKLYGIVDKLELLDGNKIRVVDYKTGKTYEEKTKEDKANLDRQLVFYKLLIDKYFDADRVEEAMLDFVEESKKTGEYSRQRRFIRRQEVDGLEKDIQDFAQDIISGEFLEREYEKNKQNEEYFELWELLKNGEKE